MDVVRGHACKLEAEAILRLEAETIQPILEKTIWKTYSGKTDFEKTILEKPIREKPILENRFWKNRF